MISFQPSENNFEMKVQNSYHRYRGSTMYFSEARHSEGNIRALRKSQPLIKGDPSCWTDIRLHTRLTPNFGVSFYHSKQILSKPSKLENVADPCSGPRGPLPKIGVLYLNLIFEGSPLVSNLNHAYCKGHHQRK